MTAPPARGAALVYQGSCNTWECDQGGHLNVRFQLERAFTGLAHLAAQLQMPRAFAAGAGATLLPLDLHVRFLKEARAGEALVMHGGVLAISEAEARFVFDMRHADGAPAAAFTLAARHAHPRELRAFAWSSRTRAAAKKLTIRAPEHARARSIDVERAPGAISIARAQELGATRIGATMARPDQCDAFGRLRPEFAFAFTSDSIPNLVAEWRDALSASDAVNPAGAAVEARIVYRNWPLAGDLVEIWSAHTELGEKTQRFVHWLLDPVTGGAWMSLEVVALTFDVATRKTIIPSPEVRAAFTGRVVPGMSI